MRFSLILSAAIISSLIFAIPSWGENPAATPSAAPVTTATYPSASVRLSSLRPPWRLMDRFT